MNEAVEARAQAARLRKQFTRTNVPAEEVWVPPPTAGDTARTVADDIEDSRADDIERATGISRDLWER